MDQTDAIRDAGTKAAMNMHYKDHAGSKHWREFGLRMIRLSDDQAAARKVFDDAYKAEASSYSSGPQYFL